MRRWERRLKDLALSLEAAGSNYFEPEIFRLNANQFLTTSRTVSFLFQKDKASIADFGNWHANNIVAPWKDDEIMKWSIVSRNTIEKEGDLDLHSSADVTLIVGYLENQDIPLRLDKNTCLSASIKRLIRFARAKLPTGVSDSAVIKIERTWVANTLPDCELLQASRYIYCRMYEACKSLANHLGTALESSIPHPTSFDDIHTGSRCVHYVKLNSAGVGKVVSRRIKRDNNFVAPEWMSELRQRRIDCPPDSLESLVKAQGEMAEATFLEHGNHIAMLWLFNEKFKVIDFVSTAPSDQADKYIFWRSISERIHYLRAKYLVWTAEAWIRTGFDQQMFKATRNLPIAGEMLQVVGIDGEGNSSDITWMIERETPDAKPTLKLKDESSDKPEVYANYLAPARHALERVKGSS